MPPVFANMVETLDRISAMHISAQPKVTFVVLSISGFCIDLFGLEHFYTKYLLKMRSVELLVLTTDRFVDRAADLRESFCAIEHLRGSPTSAFRFRQFLEA